MIEIIARSRIGFWSAFMHAGLPHLNVRDPGTLATVTIPLRPDEPAVLAGESVRAHALACALVSDVERRAGYVLDTPGIQPVEPAVHEWQPAKPAPEVRLAA